MSLVYKQPLEVFCKKRVLKNFSSFTGKHVNWLDDYETKFLWTDQEIKFSFMDFFSIEAATGGVL